MEEKLTLKYWDDIFFRLNKANEGCPVNVVYGLEEDKDGLKYDTILDAENVLVCGTTGSGKSVFLHTFIKGVMMYNTVDDLRFILVDPKRVEFSGYKNSPLLFPHLPIIHNQKELIKTLKKVVAWVENRKKDIGDTNFEQYRKEHNNHYKYLLLVIDEYADISYGDNGEIENLLQQILKEGYKYGVHVLLSSQSLLLKDETIKLFKTKVCQMMFDDENMKRLAGECFELKGCGDSLVIRGNEKIRVQNLYACYKDKYISKIDDPKLSNIYWIFELLAKTNAPVLVPFDEYDELYYDDATNVVTIYNASNVIKADKLEKYRKEKMDFWKFMSLIKGYKFNIRLENNEVALCADQFFEGEYKKLWEKYKDNYQK